MFNYQEAIEDLLIDLAPKTKQIITRRFGLEDKQRETLQAIGQDLGITRERVRQIEKTGLFKARERTRRHEPIFQFFLNQIKTSGNLRKEDILIRVLTPDLYINQVFFLLTLTHDLNRHLENKEFYTLWTNNNMSLKLAEKTIKQVAREMKEHQKLMTIEEAASFSKTGLLALASFLEASKEINRGPQGLWGLKQWPEINPRGTRDKAYIILRREKRPVHFREVASLINKSNSFWTQNQKKAHPQTVHNELIKDSRFVLVGRGIYALKEWGYEPGMVRDVIVRLMEKAGRPLIKEEIIQEVLKQRIVKKNTISLNLNNKKYFKQTLEGKYKLVET